MRTFKISAILSLWLLSAGIAYTYVTGNIYSGLSYSVLLTVAILLFAIWYSSDTSASSTAPYVVFVVLLAVLYRSYVFSFPAELIGLDPYTYARQIALIMQTGSTDAVELFFYSDASAFMIFPAMFGLMARLPASETLVVYPILIGVVVPLGTLVLTTYLVSGRGWREGGTAAVIAVVATATVYYGYVPIAQTLAIIFWSVFLYLSVRYYEFESKRAYVLAIVMLVALSFTHKLPLLIVFAMLVALASFVGLRRVVTKGLRAIAKRRGRLEISSFARNQRFGLTLTMLSGVFLYFQWAYVTDFIIAVTMTVVAVFSGGTAVSPTLATPTAAVAPQSELVGILLRRTHGLALLLVGSVAWLVVLRNRRSIPAALVVLVGSAVTVGFLFLGAFNPSSSSTSSPLRFLFLVEPVLIPIIAAVFGRVSIRRWTGVLSLGFVVLLLVTQVYSVPAIPDHPGGPREYLTAEEIEGEEFGYRYATEPVFTDWYFTAASPQLRASAEAPRQYRSFNQRLLNGTIPEQNYEYIALRTDVDIYNTQRGLWRLTWNPEATLDGTHSRIYANGGVALYKNATTRR
jgi:hypothetical protein